MTHHLMLNMWHYMPVLMAFKKQRVVPWLRISKYTRCKYIVRMKLIAVSKIFFPVNAFD